MSDEPEKEAYHRTPMSEIVSSHQVSSWKDRMHSEEEIQARVKKWEKAQATLDHNAERCRAPREQELQEIHYRGFIIRSQPDPETYETGYSNLYIYKVGQRNSDAWGWENTVGDAQDLCDAEIDKQKEWILAVAKDLGVA